MFIYKNIKNKNKIMNFKNKTKLIFNFNKI